MKVTKHLSSLWFCREYFFFHNLLLITGAVVSVCLSVYPPARPYDKYLNVTRNWWSELFNLMHTARHW